MDKEFILKVATGGAFQLAKAREDVVGVFVCGSIINDSSNWRPDYSDVDLRAVVNTAEQEAGYYEMKYGVPLEWMFVPKRRFDTREELLSTAFLAPELVNGVIIYDPTGWLQQVKDDILLTYAHPSYRIARSERLLNAARQLYQHIRKLFDAQEHVPLWDVRCAIFWTGETPSLLLNEIPNHRRLMVDLRETGERLGAPQLYSLGMETIGADRVEASDVEDALADALDTISYINQVNDRPHFHLSLDKREYWEHGIQQLISDGDHLEVLWPLLTLISAIQPTLAHIELGESSEPYDSERIAYYRLRYRSFLNRLGFLSRDDFRQRLIKLDKWMDEVERIIKTLDYEIETGYSRTLPTLYQQDT